MNWVWVLIPIMLAELGYILYLLGERQNLREQLREGEE